MMNYSKIGLICVFIVSTLTSQLNLKITSGHLPSSIEGLWKTPLFPLFLICVRVAFFSGLSLLITWYCYRKFEFFEFQIAQSAFYFAAALVSVVFLKEEFTLQKLIALLLIMGGISIYYWKPKAG